MTTKIQTAPRLAPDANRFPDLADTEVHRTRRGHRHPPAVPSTPRCPTGDPRTALAFGRQLRRWAGDEHGPVRAEVAAGGQARHELPGCPG